MEVFYKKAAHKNFAIFIKKALSWSLLLIKLFQHRCFPVNIAKFLRTPSFLKSFGKYQKVSKYYENDCRWNGVRYNYVLCLFVSFWYYYICILSRSSRRDAFFKKLFLKFRKIHKKTPVLESLFKRRKQLHWNRDSGAGVFLLILRNFRKHYL